LSAFRSTSYINRWKWSPEPEHAVGFFTGAPLYSAARRGVVGEEPGSEDPGYKALRRGTARRARAACSSRHGAANLFRMRVLRVFFVRAQFPVDRNYRRGNMKCKARQELCRSD